VVVLIASVKRCWYVARESHHSFLFRCHPLTGSRRTQGRECGCWWCGWRRRKRDWNWYCGRRHAGKNAPCLGVVELDIFEIGSLSFSVFYVRQPRGCCRPILKTSAESVDVMLFNGRQSRTGLFSAVLLIHSNIRKRKMMVWLKSSLALVPLEPPSAATSRDPT
jgi:hypothetical protein